MSLENNVKRIADSLEIIAKCMSNPQVEAPAAIAAPALINPNVKPMSAIAQNIAQQTVAVPPAHIPPQNIPAPITSGTSAPGQSADFVPTVTVMTDTELSQELVVEFRRLGKRELIDNVMKQQLGVASCIGLSGEQQQALLAAVRAIQP